MIVRNGGTTNRPVMATKDEIRTYDTRTFRRKVMHPHPELEELFRPDSDHFFVVRIEDVRLLTKLPTPPARELSHTCIYLLKGQVEMQLGYKGYRLEKNHMLFIAAGQVFSVLSISPDSAGFICHFSPKTISRITSPVLLRVFPFLQVWGHPHVELPDPSGTFILRLLQRLHVEYVQNGLQHPLLVEPYLFALLSEISHALPPAFPVESTPALTITRKFKELLYGNSGPKKSVSAYASALHITANHLNKVVKSVTGKSPIQWIDEVTVLEAKVLLFQSSLSISEVAYRVGLADPSYFARLFKKYEGTTPTAYRKGLNLS